MNHQKQPNRWTCFPTALAMVLDVPLKDIIKSLGHDGSEIIFPKRKGSFRRRGFHPQEFTELLFGMGYAFLTLEAQPFHCIPKYGKSCLLCGGTGQADIVLARTKWHHFLDGNKAVVSQLNHAIAWDGIEGYDPGRDADRCRVKIKKSAITAMHLVVEIKSLHLFK